MRQTPPFSIRKMKPEPVACSQATRLAARMRPGSQMPPRFRNGGKAGPVSLLITGKQQGQRTIPIPNTLLGLGRVRPWITWSGAQPEGPRPGFTYTSRSLLSSLALQLCLRISKVEAFVLCFHCSRAYLPRVRAPKVGQRNFCPDCREQGWPKYYSHRDFRQRKIRRTLETRN